MRNTRLSRIVRCQMILVAMVLSGSACSDKAAPEKAQLETRGTVVFDTNPDKPVTDAVMVESNMEIHQRSGTEDLMLFSVMGSGVKVGETDTPHNFSIAVHAAVSPSADGIAINSTFNVGISEVDDSLFNQVNLVPEQMDGSVEQGYQAVSGSIQVQYEAGNTIGSFNVGMAPVGAGPDGDPEFSLGGTFSSDVVRFSCFVLPDADTGDTAASDTGEANEEPSGNETYLVSNDHPFCQSYL